MEVEHIVSVTGPAVRTAQREALGLSPETPVVGTAFRFVDLKQPFLWVDAAQKVLAFEPRCMFVMLGDGKLHEEVCQYIRAKELEAHFLLPGRVQDIYKRLSALDLFVLSSRTEALPNTLIEAQASGVPVIAFDVGGIAETMIEGTTGWLVRGHTADALAGKIISTLADTAWRDAASMAGRSFVTRKFSNGRMIKSLSAVLLGDGASALASTVY
jgi:glycosyltransferase involved in cell wall biosynthesis